MKTLVRSNVSLYVFVDSETVSMTDENVTVGSPARFIIADCNSSNSTIHENVTVPDDWVGHKYLFDGTTWTQSPNWQEPT